MNVNRTQLELDLELMNFSMPSPEVEPIVLLFQWDALTTERQEEKGRGFD